MIIRLSPTFFAAAVKFFDAKIAIYGHIVLNCKHTKCQYQHHIMVYGDAWEWDWDQFWGVTIDQH